MIGNTYSIVLWEKYFADRFLKGKNIPVYIGGGIDKKYVSKILKQISPFGLDISRSLKNQRNLISKSKLKDFLNQISVG